MYYLGVSWSTSGARGISMNLIVIPPGGKAEPHSHSGFEHWGDRLQYSMQAGGGRLRLHRAERAALPENLSDSEPVIAIVARNDPEEQEHVILYDEQWARSAGG